MLIAFLDCAILAAEKALLNECEYCPERGAIKNRILAKFSRTPFFLIFAFAPTMSQFYWF